jgi:hypothetical protein
MPLKVLNNPKFYANAVHFNKKLVLLPIHQSVSVKQCRYMVKILAKWQKEAIKREINA